MIHGLNNSYLYAAKKIQVVFSNGKTSKPIQGTGFFIEKEDKIILVTNRHMVDPLFYSPDLVDYSIISFIIESYQSFDENRKPIYFNLGEVVNFNEFIVAADSNDVACLFNVKIKNPGFTINSCIDYEMLADERWINEKLCVCDSIAYPGFPQWYDKKNNTPIFRMGTIASDPRFNYSYSSVNYQNRLAIVAYEGFSTGGSSGSPVFAVQKGFQIGTGLKAPSDFFREVKLIGINAGHFTDTIIGQVKDNNIDEWDDTNHINGYEKDGQKAVSEVHSGISFFYKSNVIIDIIKEQLSI